MYKTPVKAIKPLRCPGAPKKDLEKLVNNQSNCIETPIKVNKPLKCPDAPKKDLEKLVSNQSNCIETYTSIEFLSIPVLKRS